jgi:hypothetical protein
MRDGGIDIANAIPKGFKDLSDFRFAGLITTGWAVECLFLTGVSELNGSS